MINKDLPDNKIILKDIIEMNAIHKLIANSQHSKTLNLSNKDLATLPDNIGTLTQLEKLDLSNNRLTTLPESISNLTQLTQLFLSFNRFISLPESIGNLTQLTRLEINNNDDLTSLPESIGNLTRLEELNLSGNQLTSIPERIGNLTQLRALHISDNPITSLPESIGNLRQLTYIDLEGCQLKIFPESILNLTQLQTLKLSNNNLTSIPERIGDLTQLKQLNLSFIRSLTTLPESIGKLINLERLSLKGTPLITIPESIGNLKKLDNESLKSINEVQHEILYREYKSINNVTIVPDMVIINNNINSSASLNIFYSKKKNFPYDTIYRNPNTLRQLSKIDAAAFRTYSFRGDYLVNKFLSTNIFSIFNKDSNVYSVNNIMMNENHLRDIELFKKIAKELLPLNKNKLSKSEMIEYKQKVIYYYFVILYNAIKHISQITREIVPKDISIQVYRGSKTHYLKTDKRRYYYFNSFVSTTEDKEVAYEFYEPSGCIYNFIVHPLCYYCYMGNPIFTQYIRERELLLTPYQRYLYIKSDVKKHTHSYFIMPTDLTIPTTFEEFLPWKDNIVELSSDAPKKGGRTMIEHMPIENYTRNAKRITRKNLKYNRNTQKNTKMNTQKNVEINIQKNTEINTRKNNKKNMNDYSRWTEPLSSFPGKAPTESEWKYINMVKAFLEKEENNFDE